jgi:hypothetical protein
LLQFLVSFGNVVGRQPYYFIEGAEHYPVLYALLAGPTAKGRKGTAANRIRPIFDVADNDWTRNNVTSGISSGEGILHAIHDDIYGTDKKSGVQVLVEAGVDDKRMLLDEREFSAALDSMQREGNVVSRIVRDAWDCPRVLRTLTKHNPTKVTRPHISVLGQITIDELQRKLDQGAMMSGFANRFLYACVRRSQLLPHGGALRCAHIHAHHHDVGGGRVVARDLPQALGGCARTARRRHRPRRCSDPAAVDGLRAFRPGAADRCGPSPCGAGAMELLRSLCALHLR